MKTYEGSFLDDLKTNKLKKLHFIKYPLELISDRNCDDVFVFKMSNGKILRISFDIHEIEVDEVLEHVNLTVKIDKKFILQDNTSIFYICIRDDVCDYPYPSEKVKTLVSLLAPKNETFNEHNIHKDLETVLKDMSFPVFKDIWNSISQKEKNIVIEFWKKYQEFYDKTGIVLSDMHADNWGLYKDEIVPRDYYAIYYNYGFQQLKDKEQFSF